MANATNKRLLAVGIDAGDAKLVRRLVEQNRMPFVKSLLAEGHWTSLESPSSIGSSAVWPTFVTGQDPSAHGVYSEWCWEASTMSLSRFDGRDLKPFWKPVADDGARVGILAVPYMPFVGLADGFELSECNSTLPLDGGSEFGPPRVAELIGREAARAALSHGMAKVAGPEDYANLQLLAADCLEGIKLRGALAERLLTETQPDFSVVVFTEAHESGHCLWQTAEPEHALFNENYDGLAEIKPNLKDIYQELDRQIGRLAHAAGPEATVMVFSLHGMQPALGVPTFLARVMCDLGFSCVGDWTDRSWRARALTLLAAVKRRTPHGLKEIYYKRMSPATIVRLAQPTMMPPYDWTKTRAFPLVTEQHGSIRINLEGREAKGIVPIEDYDKACSEVEEALDALRTSDGKRLAKKVIRTAESGEQALTRRLPDVLVHWEDAAFRSPLRIAGSELQFERDGNRYLSQHTNEGFCIVKGAGDIQVADAMNTKDLGHLMVQILGPVGVSPTLSAKRDLARV